MAISWLPCPALGVFLVAKRRLRIYSLAPAILYYSNNWSVSSLRGEINSSLSEPQTEFLLIPHGEDLVKVDYQCRLRRIFLAKSLVLLIHLVPLVHSVEPKPFRSSVIARSVSDEAISLPLRFTPGFGLKKAPQSYGKRRLPAPNYDLVGAGFSLRVFTQVKTCGYHIFLPGLVT